VNPPRDKYALLSHQERGVYDLLYDSNDGGKLFVALLRGTGKTLTGLLQCIMSSIQTLRYRFSSTKFDLSWKMSETPLLNLL
jgi:hypothetical protein